MAKKISDKLVEFVHVKGEPVEFEDWPTLEIPEEETSTAVPSTSNSTFGNGYSTHSKLPPVACILNCKEVNHDDCGQTNLDQLQNLYTTGAQVIPVLKDEIKGAITLTEDKVSKNIQASRLANSKKNILKKLPKTAPVSKKKISTPEEPNIKEDLPPIPSSSNENDSANEDSYWPSDSESESSEAKPEPLGETKRVGVVIPKHLCPKCGKGFNSKNYLNSHTCNPNDVICPDCFKSFPDNEHLKLHARYHDGQNELTCEFCGKIWKRLGHLVVHRRIHTGEKPFECNICLLNFGSKSVLTIHQRQAHAIEDDEKNVPNKRGSSQKPDPKTQKEYHCDQCEKVFIRKETYIVHMRIHNGIKPFLCDTCSKSFVDRRSLRWHIMTHTGEKPFNCKECSCRFARGFDLKRHVEIMHLKIRPRNPNSYPTERKHACTLCDKRFKLKNHLKVHMQAHMGDRPHICEFCDKGFLTKGDLVVHRRTHTNEKPYLCPHCNKAFSAKTAQNKHSQSCVRSQLL